VLELKAALKPLIPFFLLVGALISTTFMLCVKSMVDFVSHGYGPLETYLVLLFVLAILATSPLASPWRKEWNPVFLGGIGLLNLLALIERAIFTHKAGLPMDSWAGVVLDGRYTTTRLIDIHEPMAAVSWVLSRVYPDADSGYSLVALLPGWLLFLHFLCLSAVTVIALMMVHEFAHRESTEKTICLSLCVVAMLKASIEGGPLLPEMAVPLPFLCGLLFGPKAARIGLAVAAVYLPYTLWWSGSQQFAYQGLKALGGFLFLEAPLLWEHARQSQARHWYLVVALYGAILLSLPWMQYRAAAYTRQPPFTLGTLLYGYEPLGTGKEITIFSDRDLVNFQGSPIDIQAVWRGQKLRAYRAKVNRATTPMEICDLFGLNLWWTPVTWFEGIAYYELKGQFPKPSKGWPSSGMVTEYQVAKEGDGTVIVFGIRGGGRLVCAVDALPPGRSILTAYRTYNSRPRMPGQWHSGPGGAGRAVIPVQASAGSPAAP
jgi:hypothetical protein